ncbi:MAG: hypothetical protein KC549_10690 [Myxococcales bacterium]|nr:hypothetical protein [Myxococcales bacterium]MCB9545890.1 hypothetical protein [Myxococcales bacterium]
MATLTDAHMVIEPSPTRAIVVASVHASFTPVESFLMKNAGLQFRLHGRLRFTNGLSDDTLLTLASRIITAGGTVHFEAAALPSQLEDKRGGRRDLYARFDLESLEPILPASVRLDSNRVRYVAEQRRAGELLAW